MQFTADGIHYRFQSPATGKTENLPDFIIIGAQKSGTSALRHNLDKHPDVYMAHSPDRKGSREIHFFNTDRVWARGIDWYKSLFPHNELVQGEKSPNYISILRAHERMHQIVPNAKLVLMLRNPVSRVYSHWNHFNQTGNAIKRGWRVTSFEAALAEAWRGEIPVFKNLIDNGIYIQQIQHLLRFYPKEQLFVGIAERFKANPQDELNKAFGFLGLDEKDVQAEDKHVRKYQSPMEPATRTLLEELYAPFNEALFKFLGYRIAEWE